MEKIFILKGLDCPNCSAKIEKEVGELAGVSSSSINLMKQSLTISVEEDALSLVTKQIETIVHSHEPDVTVTEYISESSVSTQETKSEDYNNKIEANIPECAKMGYFPWNDVLASTAMTAVCGDDLSAFRIQDLCHKAPQILFSKRIIAQFSKKVNKLKF